MSNDEWLASLKVGDKVVVRSRFSEVVREVTKLTSTQIVVGTVRYRRATGIMVGGRSFYLERLVMPTNDILQKIALQNLRTKIGNVQWQEQSYEVLKAVEAVLPK